MSPIKATTLVLDRRLSASQARRSADVKRILTSILKEAIIRVYQTYFYQVDFGPDVRPQVHIVSHDLFCTCRLEEDCPAVTAVKYYLQNEQGVEAKRPRPGYFPTVPHKCPTCGAGVQYDPHLTSRNRGLGWRCEKGGVGCYWKHQAQALQTAYAEKWKRLGLDPAHFQACTDFSFPDGYDPERLPSASIPGCTLNIT
ncbi:MAG: hypothetical protein ABSB41_07160 [Anaerolineales bacterium]|jgi:hypothetical protein